MNKVCMIGNNAGGMYGFRGDLILALKEKGYQVSVLVPSEDETDVKAKKIYELGVKVIQTGVERRGMNPAKDIGLLKQYISILKEEKPDIVVTYTIKPNIYAGFACRMLRIPFVCNVTGLGTAFQKEGMLQTMVSTMYKHTIYHAKKVLFENVENRDILVNKGLVKKENTYVLNGAGVNIERFSKADYPEDGPIRFLFMGRIMKEKGVEELFSAMQKLVDDNLNVSLDVLGRYEENYKTRLEEYEKQGWLRYHGVQEDVRPYIANAHCFVLPSWHEGMANTNLECASSGRPVITSNIHGCLEAVEENVSGYLCEKQNADSLYHVMKKFIELPYEEKIEMGSAGRTRMELMFDKRLVIKETIAQIES